MQPDIETAVRRALESVQRPFWMHGDFWIFVILGIASLVASYFAYREAKKAKRAATLAGRTVKLQTVVIELTETSHALDDIEMEIRFNEARDLLSEVSKRVRRAVSPFAAEEDLSQPISTVLGALDSAQAALKTVRPSDPAMENAAANSVYFAVEDNFANINNSIAGLIGLFEKQTMDFGDKNA